MEADLTQLLTSLSRSLEFGHEGILCHHQRTTLISLYIGKTIGLSEKDMSDLFKAAIIHDLGAVTWRERRALIQFDLFSPWEHCLRGYELTVEAEFLNPIAEVIIAHHDRWSGNNPSSWSGDRIPLLSRIIHLADRVDVLINNDVPILSQFGEILLHIREQAGTIFDPELSYVLLGLAENESFWLDIMSPWVSDLLGLITPSYKTQLEMQDFKAVAEIFAKVVDAKSPFTYRHSQGVAVIARYLAERLSMTSEVIELVEIAGLLHDLGKLSIPDNILEKKGPLSREEFSLVKQHPYYTYWLLRPVATDWPLAEWTGYHHERLDKRGYPFRVGEDEMDLQSRLIAVADVFTALHEDRPYRKSLSWPEIKRLIRQQTLSRALDRDIVDLLFNCHKDVEALWSGLSQRLLLKKG
jgi:HD-GYP domain-containing protein (c-di-GMP phosphodiesterase class II)